MKQKIIQRLTTALLVAGLTGCASYPPRDNATYKEIDRELGQAAVAKPAPAPPAAVENALLPPLTVEIPKAGKPVEQRFDLVVNNAPAVQVLMGIVSGTRYSMLVSPEVAGTVSVNLKDVTVFDALDALRDLYGYDYRVDGTRIFVEAPGLRTRIFKINYLDAQRKGTSDTRVISGSVSDVPTAANGNAAASPGGTTVPGATSKALETSKVSTTVSSDFWGEVRAALDAIIGNKDGRNVIVSPQSGVIVVRAMPKELREVASYLKAAQISVDRQVMLEAKIIEVQLNDGFQTGINWAAFGQNDQHRFSVGADATSFQLPGGAVVGGSTLGSVLGNGLPGSHGATPDGLFGLAFQTGSFAALINFLQTQGAVHVLSSPRIATLNNQKAVLKVGTDEFFVTNVSTTTVTGTATTTTPNVTLQPFFSGIALDVTPQIDDKGDVILHIHPSVSQVTEKDKQINLGSNFGTLNLPLASSSVSETDSLVRAQDGNIVAIGGLMRQATTDNRAQVPGVGDVPLFGALFRNTNSLTQKRELVILLKPTVIQGSEDWSRDIRDSQRRIESMGAFPGDGKRP